MNKLIQSMLETSKQYGNTTINHSIFHQDQLVIRLAVNQKMNQYVVDVIGEEHPEIYNCPEEAATSLMNKIDQLNS